MKEIKLSTTGKHKDKFIAFVDNEDYKYLNQFKWYVMKSGLTFYAARKVTSLETKILKSFQMHRVILNTPDNLYVDHIDHNGLNNQRSNIRNCTRSENTRNKTATGVSKYLGVAINVSWCKNMRKDGTTRISYAKPKYMASIRDANKILYLGRFEKEEDAARAYDKKAKELFKEFANLNFK